ncbi:MAG: DUF1513 domain-containing protein [Geminicoccaceae bacterium]
MPLPRRAALTSGLGAAAWLALRACAARAEAGPLFLVCRVHPALGAGVALVDEHAGATAGPELPDRGHGLCLRPGTAEAVVFARRPGTFAAVFEPSTGLVLRRFDTPSDRHFYGHGVFDPTGGVLVATENDFTRGVGVLGLYDARDGYRRIGELPAHGIGPHDIALLPDGRTLAIANGGILTVPETGRDMLNLDTMQPSLNLVELASGALLQEERLPERLRHLSIRHLDQNGEGVIATGLQWEGDRAELVPLVALDRGSGLETLEIPEATLRLLAGYVGSISFDRSGRFIAASCPRGNHIAFWHADGGFLRGVAITDACAVGPAVQPGRFLAASGTGQVVEIDPASGVVSPLGERAPAAYDNHLLVV